MPIRFAILAGVSTDAQATPEKQSIPDQLAHCRQKIASLNGSETCGPYIMDGYSRTGYDSLEIAMQEIPPLAQAIHAATADQYDVLIMDNFDRLGDLGFIVKTRFKKLRKQLHSARQSGKLAEPDQYDPYASEGDDIAMYVEGIIQSYRINKIRRAWNIGVPERARKGLHPLSLPFGYKLTAKDQPAEQTPHEVKLIRQMKDLYLAGAPLEHICRHADASGIKPRRASAWQREVIKRILHNRYYAGQTTYGKIRTVKKQRIPVPPSQWITAPGQHIPLWDMDTYRAILSETERRTGRRSRFQAYALSGLLTCSVCRKRLHRSGKLGTRYPIHLSCPGADPHVQIEYHLAHKLIAAKIVNDLQTLPASTEYPYLPTGTLERLESQRRLVQEGYENKLYTLLEASGKIVAIETELEKISTQREQHDQHTAQRQTLLQLTHETPDRLQHWILHDDPAKVNHLLTALCTTVTITPAYDLVITWR